MKESKAIDALTKIFHIETYTGENGNYELSSNDWGLNFNVRIREYTIFIQDGKGARCSIDSDEDVDTMCQEIVAFIGEVIKDESKNYTFKNRSQILAWSFNCNTNYVDYLKMAFDMNSEENEFDYAKRKRSVTNSNKQIKSSVDVLYDYINRGVLWEDVEAYADELVQNGTISEDEYNRERDKLHQYFNNASEKAEKTAWEQSGKERGWLNSSHRPIKSAANRKAVFEIMDEKLMEARRNVRSCISINTEEALNPELQNIDELIGDALTHTEMVKNGDYEKFISSGKSSDIRDTRRQRNTKALTSALEKMF